MRATALLLALFLGGSPVAPGYVQDDAPGPSANTDPSLVINEARRYAEAGQLDLAISTYQQALALLSGSNAYDPIIRFNLATLHAAKGIDAFQADALDDAIGAFRSSLLWNSYSRDIRFNLCQAMYIQASRLKEQGAPPEELLPLYREIVTEAERVRDMDPANANLLLILAYTYRNLGDENGAAIVFDDSARARLEVNAVRMEVATTDTKLSGVIKNLKLVEGDPVRLRFTMVALDGTPIATSGVQVAAPAVGQTVTFTVTIATTQDVAGWRYEID
jgi:tetratricopeptide (TPR) repeat protein